LKGAAIRGFEPAAGYAVVDVDALDRVRAHELVVRAIGVADPAEQVIVGGDVVLSPIGTHV
jgi:hypothetical protein